MSYTSALALITLTFISACGVKGPPRPPIRNEAEQVGQGRAIPSPSPSPRLSPSAPGSAEDSP